MPQDISSVIKALIDAKMQNLLSYFDGEADFIYDEEYDRHFSFDIVGTFLYQDSSRGSNPYSGQEFLIDQKSGKKLWICDYTGYFAQKQSFEPAYVYPVLKSGRLAYLESCGTDLTTAARYEEDGYLYISVTEGPATSMLRHETIYSNDRLIFMQLSNCILKL